MMSLFQQGFSIVSGYTNGIDYSSLFATIFSIPQSDNVCFDPVISAVVLFFLFFFTSNSLFRTTELSRAVMLWPGYISTIVPGAITVQVGTVVLKEFNCVQAQGW